MFLPVFNNDISRESMKEKHLRVSRDFGIQIEENADGALRLTIKGKEIQNLSGTTCTIDLVDDTYLIINDSTPYKNVHAFDLNGNWLWDIESSKVRNGEDEMFFQAIVEVVTDEFGTRQLVLTSFPITYHTELATGKNTKIVRIEDDTNYK